jgi:hypothetical protein
MAFFTPMTMTMFLATVATPLFAADGYCISEIVLEKNPRSNVTGRYGN